MRQIAQCDILLEVDCSERDRLFQEYFDALQEQHKIQRDLSVLKDAADPKVISIAQTQAEAAIEDCYDAWHALNEHQYEHRCGPSK